MNKEVLTFYDIEMEKHNIHYSKHQIYDEQ